MWKIGYFNYNAENKNDHFQNIRQFDSFIKDRKIEDML